MIKNTSNQDRVVRTNKRPWQKYALIMVFISTIVIWIGFAIKDLRDSDLTVSRERLQVAQVTRSDLTRDIVAQGRVVAANSPTLYAPADGVVTFEVKAGDSVTQGQLLASIESHKLNSELKQARSQLSRLQVEVSRQEIQAKRNNNRNRQKVELEIVNLTAARREMRRAQQSIEKNLISQLDFEKAQDELSRVTLQLAQAKKNAALELEAFAFEQRTHKLEVEFQQLSVDELQRRVHALTIHSPVSGLIGRLSSKQKSAVTAHSPLLTVVDLSSLELETRVPENLADDLGLAMPVEIQLGDKKVTGSIAAISPEVIDSQVVARVRFDNAAPSNLRQNQRLSARIILQQKSNVLSLPRGAFLDGDAGRYAWKVDGSHAVRTPITIGAIGLRTVEIVQGLTVGDTVIISGTDQYREAQTLTLTN